MRNIILICLLFLSFLVHANEQEMKTDIITYPWTDGAFKEDKYYLSLLTLALDLSSDKYGDYKLVKAESAMFQRRAIREIRSFRGKLDIVWTMTSREREEQLTPIRFPLLRGLGGYRISLIRKKAIEKFKQIKQESDLKEIFAGQGTSWPDSKILENNQYNVVQAHGHEALFKMLLHSRFDYMPRALHEVWNEAEMFDDLVVERNFALYYPSPYYFFVNPKNTKLIKRLEYGLAKAEASGQFKALFENHAVTQNMLQKAELANRKVFYLENDLLTRDTKDVLKNYTWQTSH